MPDIETLRNRYFVQPRDANPPSEPVPQTYQNSRVTPFIHAREYYSELSRVIAAVNGSDGFIYIAGWVLSLIDLNLDGSGTTMVELLKQKSRAGVDVRVLGFIRWILRFYWRSEESSYDIKSVRTVMELRDEPTLMRKCCLNVINHPAGGVHCKLAIVGSGTSAVAFTGGLDLWSERFSSDWHDVQAKVEGQGVQGIYDMFKDMWNQMLVYSSPRMLPYARPMEYRIELDDGSTPTIRAVVPRTPRVTDRLLRHRVGDHNVQSLVTVPAFNLYLSPDAPPIDFAPSGNFQIKLAWRKAILAAEQYIYMDDQWFMSTEVMSWINEALRGNTDLKVIFLTGQFDPNDTGDTNRRINTYRTIALLDGLIQLRNVDNRLQPRHLNRVAFYKRDGTVHGKTTLIDDNWAIIGAANCARRSLYTDVEHSISVVDPANEMVRDYRVKLWGYHFGLSSERRAVLANLDQALNIWDSSWGAPGTGVALPSQFQRISLNPAPTRPEIDETWRNLVGDPDSRELWRIPLGHDDQDQSPRGS